jgi:hypothetical protein
MDCHAAASSSSCASTAPLKTANATIANADERNLIRFIAFSVAKPWVRVISPQLRDHPRSAAIGRWS